MAHSKKSITDEERLVLGELTRLLGPRLRGQDLSTEGEEVTTAEEDSPPGEETEKALRERGIYYILGEIKSEKLKPIHQDLVLKHTDGWRGDVQILINSLGGDLDATWSLVDLMAFVDFRIRTIAVGSCESAAVILLAAGTKGHRLVARNTTLMLHRYTWGNYGSQAELVAARRGQDIEYEKLLNFWVKASKYKSPKQVEQKLLLPTDHFMTAKEALKHGIVDRFLEGTKNKGMKRKR